ncbi:anti-sigma factor antagonist [Streptomyces sp. H27-D2]|uniref:anti-sigma factor antagonist n=1 Tax=Streptomyces sp. H27-D2 TaxID=3046304 RepID=UPI002DC037DB|nr:anti-sigma factor antagonist [Streptomyces sp. H27-D2]MEC4017001.1 anti-sigma factor antagonist [Streptomyces sp. H27-D2]
MSSTEARVPDEIDAPEPLVRTWVAYGYTVIELRGEIDISTVELLGGHLDTATSPPHPARSAGPAAGPTAVSGAVTGVVIDLRSVEFIDCAGLSLLCRAYRRLRGHGATLRLVCDHPLTLRMLRLTGLFQSFDPVPTLTEALARGREDGGCREGRQDAHGGGPCDRRVESS